MSLGSFLVILSSLAFGTLALFAQRSYEAGFGQVTLLMVRFGIATILLLALALWKRPQWPGKSKMGGLLVMGVLYVGQSYTFFAALKHIPASMVSLLLYLYPGIVTLAAVLFFQERMFESGSPSDWRLPVQSSLSAYREARISQASSSESEPPSSTRLIC